MIPLTRPTVPKSKSLHKKIDEVLTSGMLTNAKYVKEFESNCGQYLKAKHVVAVDHGTSALTLAAKCLALRGEVIIPSFTFTSGGHSLLWNNLKPVFVDINRETYNIDADKIEQKITKKTRAILATHIFGNPCAIAKIQKIAKKHKLKVIYDAAHAFGAKYKNKSVANFGDVTIFSFTPTKVLTTAEGGLVVVKDKKLADKLRIGRDNGDSFNRPEEFLGITARMSEFSAILGLETLRSFPQNLKRRAKMAKLYQQELANIDGISFQKILPQAKSAHKEAAILIDKSKCGFSRDDLLKELHSRDIEAKVYFDPPLHKKKVYTKYKNISLPNTKFVSDHIISLPLYSHMPAKEVRTVCSVIKNLAK